jgi:hypothetical protein
VKYKNLETSSGLVFESDIKLTVRASAINTTREFVKIIGDPLAQGFQK